MGICTPVVVGKGVGPGEVVMPCYLGVVGGVRSAYKGIWRRARNAVRYGDFSSSFGYFRFLISRGKTERIRFWAGVVVVDRFAFASDELWGKEKFLLYE